MRKEKIGDDKGNGKQTFSVPVCLGLSEVEKVGGRGERGHENMPFDLETNKKKKDGMERNKNTRLLFKERKFVGRESRPRQFAVERRGWSRSSNLPSGDHKCA